MSGGAFCGLTGRAAADAERRESKGGKTYAACRLAVDIDRQREGDPDPQPWWITALAFGRLADALAAVRKGEALRGEVELLTRSGLEVANACGVPPSLFSVRGDGTAQRESFRRLLHSTVQPLARLVAAELTAKLEAPIAFNFDALFAADLSGRARAFQSMVGGGMDVAKAAGLAGLMESE